MAVDDTLQNVFLKMHTGLVSLKDETKLQSWLYQIVRNAIIDYYRSQKPIDAWQNRERITPKVTGKAKPRILEIYKLLPKTNCSECGQPTCMMFASLATEGIKGSRDCPPLFLNGPRALDDYLSKFNFT